MDKFVAGRAVKAHLTNSLVYSLLALFAGSAWLRSASSLPGTVVLWGGGHTLPYVDAETRYTAIAAGLEHSLALARDGAVVAWSWRNDGQATLPAGLGNVVAIAAGEWHSLALKNDGTVVAWGHNSMGQTNVPPGLTDVVAISAGNHHSLALKQDGTVVAWGNPIATNVPFGLSGVKTLAGGAAHSLALKNDGTVVGWGSNGHGQVTIPPGLSNVVGIAAGDTHSLAVKADGSIVGWGDNTFLQIDELPTEPINAVAVAGGKYHTFALLSDGSLLSWGGDGEFFERIPHYWRHPSDAVAFSLRGVHGLYLKNDGTVVDGDGAVPGLSGIVDAASIDDYDYVLTLRTNGTVLRCGYSQQFGEFPYVTNVKAMASDDWYCLFLKTNGSVVSVGEGEEGGTYTLWKSNVIAVAVGGEQSLALMNDGTVQSWSSDVLGGVSNVVAIVSGYHQCLALKNDGTLVAWRETLSSATPSVVPAGLNDVAAIGAGSHHSIALRSNGTVVAWGSNTYGQTNVPPGLGNVMAIAAGKWHNLALRSNGTVVAWGRNDQGQSTVPADLTGVVSIFAGAQFNIAIKRPSTRARLEGPAFIEGNLQFTLLGEPGVHYRIEVSPDLLTWTPWTNFPTGPHHFVDSSATNHVRRFYRAVAP